MSLTRALYSQPTTRSSPSIRPPNLINGAMSPLHFTFGTRIAKPVSPRRRCRERVSRWRALEPVYFAASACYQGQMFSRDSVSKATPNLLAKDSFEASCIIV